MECALIARIIGGPYAVLVAEQLHVSGAQVILGLTLAGRVTLFISSQPGHSNQCYSRQSEPCAERVERFWISLSDDNAGVALSERSAVWCLAGHRDRLHPAFVDGYQHSISIHFWSGRLLSVHLPGANELICGERRYSRSYHQQST
jgi:hypothetical protein